MHVDKSTLWTASATHSVREAMFGAVLRAHVLVASFRDVLVQDGRVKTLPRPRLLRLFRRFLESRKQTCMAYVVRVLLS
jgi:hypothetical protein